MAIESKNLLVWVKAMSRGQALPLDASEVHESLSAAESYAASAIAYAGQSVKALGADGKYHEYILQPSESGYVLEEVGAIKEEDLKQYVRVVDTLPESGQIEGVLYICGTTGSVWTGSAWKQVFWEVDLSALTARVKALEDEMPNKAPLNAPAFTGKVTIDGNEAATKSYVDGLLANMVSDVPGLMNGENYVAAKTYRAGETYRVAEAGMYFGHECEMGDLLIVLNTFAFADGDANGNAQAENVMVIQANIDGAVTSSAGASTVGEIVVFDAVTGKVIKGSGVQIASLTDAIAKAHEHANKTQLDTYDKTQAELLEAAKTEAQGLVDALADEVNGKLDDKAGKADTLAGYGIQDAYTKTEVDDLLRPVAENLNSKAATKDVEDWIAAAKEEALTEAATDAAEKLAERVGDIPADTSLKSYIDTAVGSGGTASAQAIAQAKQEAIDAAKAYADAALTVTVF